MSHRWLLLLVFLLSGCAVRGYHDFAAELASFHVYAPDPRIRHEPGAEEQARRVAEHLPSAIAQVEAGHYLRFLQPPRVHVCGTDDCFHRFVDRRLNLTAAVVYNNRLVLAPRLFDREPRRLRPVLVHELSHLHLGQRRGHYTAEIPIWFHEGLASLVADGGGADLATDEDALRAIGAGRHFQPDQQHLPWVRKAAPAWDLSIHVFYRQSLLFVRHLRERDAARFRALLEALQAGEDFDSAFAATFHMNQANAARQFFAAPTCTPSESAAACSPVVWPASR
jgi:hypothetical protein